MSREKIEQILITYGITNARLLSQELKDAFDAELKEICNSIIEEHGNSTIAWETIRVIKDKGGIR